MHTVMIVTAGLILLGVFCGIGQARDGAYGVRQAVRRFLPVWFIASIINLGVGVLSAGYTVAQELPILVPVFGIPALVALGIARWAKDKD